MKHRLSIAASLILKSMSMGTWQAYIRIWVSWEELETQVGGCQSGKTIHFVLFAWLWSMQGVEELLTVRPLISRVLLVHQDGSLSRCQFLTIFRRCLKAKEFNNREFCTHYFIIGSATEASRWGLGEEVFMKIGRWESVRFQGYIRPQLLLVKWDIFCCLFCGLCSLGSLNA